MAKKRTVDFLDDGALHPVHRLICVVALVMVFTCLSLLGQQGGRASLTGTVTDASGSVVPEVTLTVVNTDTGLQVQTKTSNVGTYNVPLLPLGGYSVTARKEGFQTETRRVITLT